jgi:hypothetical protein
MMTDNEMRRISNAAQRAGLSVVGGRFAPPTLKDLPQHIELHVKSTPITLSLDDDNSAISDIDIVEYVSKRMRHRNGGFFQLVLIPGLLLRQLDSSRQSAMTELTRGVTYVRKLSENGQQIAGQRDFLCHGPFTEEHDAQTFIACAEKSFATSLDEAYS